MTDGLSTTIHSDANSRVAFRRRLIGKTAYLVYLVMVVWLGVKLFWWIRFGIPVANAPNADVVWRTYYPELWSSGAVDSDPAADDDQLDVLLLGGSVLEQVVDGFATELRKVSARPVRIYSLAKSAHTSRDSRNKLSRLSENPFDWIVFYHGINDVRMNCCSDAEFHQDYSHCAWYDGFSRRLRAGRMTLTDLVWDQMDRRISLGPPDPSRLELGVELKTPPAFRDNINAIVAASQRPGKHVILATFAYHIPANYSRERFRLRELDYGHGQYELEAELWGKPANVAATIDAHNQQVREVAAEYSNTLLVELAREMPRSGVYFSDPCHLTSAGCDMFVSWLIAAVRPLCTPRETP